MTHEEIRSTIHEWFTNHPQHSPHEWMDRFEAADQAFTLTNKSFVSINDIVDFFLYKTDHPSPGYVYNYLTVWKHEHEWMQSHEVNASTRDQFWIDFKPVHESDVWRKE